MVQNKIVFKTPHRKVFSDYSNGMSNLGMLANTYFQKIQQEYPEFFETAAEQWMFTYNIQKAKKGNDAENYAAIMANKEIKEFYENLNENGPEQFDFLLYLENEDKKSEQKENKKQEYNKTKEWDGALADERLDEFYEKKGIEEKDFDKTNNHKHYDDKRRKRIDVKKIFDEIDEKYPEVSEYARELRNKEYLGQRSKNLPDPDTMIDRTALQRADEKLEEFYNNYEKGLEYLDSKDLKNPENIDKETALDNIGDVIKDIEQDLPEHYEEAIDFWVYHFERVHQPDKEISKDQLAKRMADKRLEHFYREKKEKNDSHD